MHDPLVVAWEVPLPLPRRVRYREHRLTKRWGVEVFRRTSDENKGQRVYPWWRLKGYMLVLGGHAYGMRTLATIWHVEPRGHDSGHICKHSRKASDIPRWKLRLSPWLKQRDDSPWVTDRSWKWHVWHWRVQLPWLQGIRARLFDRCTECGRKGRPNVSHQWDGKPLGWWKFRSREGLYHMECSALVSLRRQRTHDEALIRHLVAALRVVTDESEVEALDRLTQAGDLEFHLLRRLQTVHGYERDSAYRLVKAER